MEEIFTDFIHWQIVPRHDKLLAEMQYMLHGRNLHYDQAEKYLTVINQNLDEVEENLNDKLSELIELYSGRLMESK